MSEKDKLVAESIKALLPRLSEQDKQVFVPGRWRLCGSAAQPA